MSNVLLRVQHLLNARKFVHEWSKILFLRLGLARCITLHFHGYEACPVKICRDQYPLLSGVLYILEKGGIYDPCNDSIVVKYEGKRAKFKHIIRSMDYAVSTHIYSTFYDDEYGFLDVKGRSVVDVGASIGDTAIYFVLRGAEKVTAFEAAPPVCQLLRDNIRENNLEDKIEIECSAAGPPSVEERSSLLFCVNKLHHGASRVVSTPSECREGIVVKVPVKPIPPADVLKMDCEGCEYSIIGKMEEPLYSEIGMEYHGNPSSLINRLRNLGYSVRVLRRNPSKRYGEIGIMHAVLVR